MHLSKRRGLQAKLSRVRCLNEAVPGSCRNVFKSWEKRLEPTQVPLRSNEDDPELLLHIPFDGAVKLKAISVIGSGDPSKSPSKMKVWVNREDVDFAAAERMPPVQEWELQPENVGGVLEYPTQVAKFSGVHTLDMLFTGNFGADITEIHFVGLKGEFSERKRAAVEAVYESRGIPADHKVPEKEAGSWGGAQ
ncbi:galactose-binding domain-like protein [Dunaliella salina]|uniref:Galactose-binding domain-like protein n=1 Tax=Dunaliella salina TaxID=3046 RepID=A0ABQ7GBC9_DUNSA|nr:galactose-binding domain-like protein [Dunaliella salina]|eukprot:KAF5831916.1 galactose-binding domain-like protein [Dunaliella salina]